MGTRLLATAALIAASGLASADQQHRAMQWQVEITNVTPGQRFTPILPATHYAGVDMFESGESATLTLSGRPGQYLRLAGMLIPTNDTFVGVDSIFLPMHSGTTIHALAWDAGTEANDWNNPVAIIDARRIHGRW